MSDFKKQGGSLTGREERYDGFQGEPKSVGGALGGATTGSGLGHSGTGHTGHTGTGTGLGHTDHSGTGLGQTSRDTTGTTTGTTGTTGTHKPSMMDKLNPKKDADGDGKAGMMD